VDNNKTDVLISFEQDVKNDFDNYRLKLTSISNDDLIDVLFGYFGECLKFDDVQYAKHQITLIGSYLFQYAYSQENKPTKADNEKFNHATKSIIKKTIDFKNLLFDTKEFPEHKDLEILHKILKKMIINPYAFVSTPDDIPGFVLKKGYVEEKIIKILSDSPRDRRYVRQTKKALLQIDELLKKG